MLFSSNTPKRYLFTKVFTHIIPECARNIIIISNSSVGGPENFQKLEKVVKMAEIMFRS